jgi:pSer/pThr/pTyr-binding forkhead associated (FHA) protein/tetratricopeptide (TPR) repeat protein
MNPLPMLTFMKEGETFKSQSLEKEVSIGRGEGNVIRLEDRAVSRKHAIVRKTAEGVHIEKQSDFAPIRLNGIECTRALLKEGDIVEIGPFRMRLDQPKESVREAPKAFVAPALALTPAPTPIMETARDPEATVAIPDSDLHVQESMPTEAIGFGPNGGALSIGDFTGQISTEAFNAMPEIAQPIIADGAGAEAGSQDPGTNIFGNDSADGGGLPALEIDLGSTAPAEDPLLPDEISASPFHEDAATKVLSSDVKARIEIAEGMANVTSLPLSKNEIFLGRGKECDVVLNDKKSSRKNTVIVRDGNHYRVKDLDSSNGTYVNNSPIKDVELSADDVIRVGDVEIRFVADSADYQKRKDHFEAVEAPLPPAPDYLPSEGLSPFVAPISGTPIGYNSPAFGAPPPVSNATPAPVIRKGPFGIIDKYVKNFGSLKPMQKILVVLCAVLFLSWYFEDELGLNDTPKQAPRVVKKSVDGKPAAPTDYDSLDPKKKAQIDDAIRKATDFMRLQDFDKAIYEVQQRVFTIIPDFAQGKEIERYSQDGKRRKSAIEEEAKRKEEEEKLKARIADLEKSTREYMAQKKYDQAKESFSEILSVDPDNANVSEWKKQIEAWAEEQDRIEKEKQVQEEINKRAWDTYNEGFELHKNGKFREAIELYKKVMELGATEEVLMKKSVTMIKTCQDSIRELREPHLKKAKQFEKDGDLGSAFKEFQVATEIDPPHPEGWAGMDRIRDVLTERAKILYTEAVIAESYSDFKTAHSKFVEITKMAPDGSLYFQRATRKLQSYLNFHEDAQ